MTRRDRGDRRVLERRRRAAPVLCQRGAKTAASLTVSQTSPHRFQRYRVVTCSPWPDTIAGLTR